MTEDNILSIENSTATDTNIVNIDSTTEGSFSSMVDITDNMSDIDYNVNSTEEGEADNNTADDIERLHYIVLNTVENENAKNSGDNDTTDSQREQGDSGGTL